MRTCSAGLATLIVLLMDPAHGQVYGGRTEDGSVVLSNFRSSDTPVVVIAPPGLAAEEDAGPPAGLVTSPVQRRARMYDPIVRGVAQDVDVSAQLLHAVIAIESAYLPNAVSPKGAQGLMQLMPATAQRFGVVNPFDPRQNVLGGAMYLKWLLQRFDGDLTLAIAGYNAGEDAVVRAGFRVPPFAETQRYVPRVMERFLRPPVS